MGLLSMIDMELQKDLVNFIKHRKKNRILMCLGMI